MNTIQNKFDVIILSLVVDPYTHGLTKCCIDSYINTGGDLINKIFVVETNPNFTVGYNNPKVELIKPNEEFNYNKFYNIALDKCNAEYIIGPNNDILIKPNCLQNILTQFQNNPELQSISPVDRTWHRHSQMYLPHNNKLYYGYVVGLHVMGCLFAARKSVFNQLGYLDETFYFYYQDNDYAAALERCKLKHALYTGAEINHKVGSSAKYSSSKYQYQNKQHLQTQQNYFVNKWGRTAPYNVGGYKPFKTYCKC